MTATYSTPLNLARFLGIEESVPSPDTSGERVKEQIGTGTGTVFFVANAYIVNDSFGLYHHGTTALQATALTAKTHFTLNKDLGRVDMTAAGNNLRQTNNLYASYSHTGKKVSNTELQNALNRAQDELDRMTNDHWSDGTSATPDYTQINNEKQTGKGLFERDYFVRQKPIPNVSTTLSQTATAGTSTVFVASTNGFLSTGTVNFSTNKVAYTSKNQTAFLGCSGVTAVAASGIVHPHVIEISTSDPGGSPNWEVMEADKDYDLVKDTGKLHLFKNELRTDTDRINFDSAPLRNVPNRLRVTYIWGESTIPDEIERVTLMIASKDLAHKILRKAHLSGKNDFNPTTVDIDDKWIQETFNKYRVTRITTV